jgi:hypothetical protein
MRRRQRQERGKRKVLVLIGAAAAFVGALFWRKRRRAGQDGESSEVGGGESGSLAGPTDAFHEVVETEREVQEEADGEGSEEPGRGA